jgi:hypothetical protein
MQLGSESAWSIGYAVATDTEGNIIVVGSFRGTVDLGGGPLVSNNSYADMFIAKFSPAGEHLWSRCAGGSLIDEAIGVAVDGNNNVVVTGTFSSQADFGGGPLTYAGGGSDIFVAKYSPSGEHIWSEGFGSTSPDHANDITVDGSGNILITGDFSNSIDFGGALLSPYDGFSDAFVLKLSSSGAHLWSRAFGGPSKDNGYGIAVDGNGNVLVTGLFTNSIDLGKGRIFSDNGPNIFIAKFSPSGTTLWSKCLVDTSGGLGIGIGRSVAVDVNGDIVVTGRFQGQVDFGGGLLSSTSPGYPDGFVVKYSAAGQHLWCMALGAVWSEGMDVALDGNGDIVLTGSFIATADFGGDLLSSAGGSQDIFVVKYSATANHIWSRRFGDIDADVGQSVAIDINGNVIVTGQFSQTLDFGYGPLTADFDLGFLTKFNY